MAKSNIIYRSYRLNLDNEQHRRVNKVLAELNTDIHKSVNQFITDAILLYGRNTKRIDRKGTYGTGATAGGGIYYPY